MKVAKLLEFAESICTVADVFENGTMVVFDTKDVPAIEIEGIKSAVDEIMKKTKYEFCVEEGECVVHILPRPVFDVKLDEKVEKTGLIFPPKQIECMMGGHEKISPDGSVFFAAVIEYLVAEVMELSGNEARNRNERSGDGGKIIIRPRDIEKSITDDDQLKSLVESLPGFSFTMPPKATSLSDE